MDSEQNVLIPGDDKEAAKGAYAPFASLIVGLKMWLCRTGAPQITVAVQNLGREVNSWTAAVDKQARRLVSHVRMKVAEGVLLLRCAPRDLKEKKLKLLLFSDADHAGNVSTRKSVSGVAMVLAGPYGTWALLDWISKTQRTISLSTAEAELLAAQLALRECLTVLILFDLLGVDVEVEMLVDSSAALSVLLTGLSSKLRYSAKSQGLAAGWCAAVLRDFGIKARKVATDHNLADLFTKAVSALTFNNLTALCGWVPASQVGRPRCAHMHPAPLSDEHCRCLHFVDKEGDFCADCRATPDYCPCFNGAVCWDIRAPKEEDRIPCDSAPPPMKSIP